MECADVDGGTLLPGDAISCGLTIKDELGHEDAGSLQLVAHRQWDLWLSGGSGSLDSAFFGTLDVGIVVAGANAQSS